MRTYHIHISGLVQGVGFRPRVARLAAEMRIKGCVSNAVDGVHIEFNAAPSAARLFYERLLEQPPAHAIITWHSFRPSPSRQFASFRIRESSAGAQPDLLLMPDISLCPRCREELLSPANRRHGYAFTTCLECGPRYSIMTALPYDREHTTMASLCMCDDCRAEYNDVHNHRHYSQTNSCRQCAIPMHLYADGGRISSDPVAIPEMINRELAAGRIIAVKGIGGYLLLCDATDETAVATLRARKCRPQKPLALLYPDIAAAARDVELRPEETEALQSDAAPIVLCRLKDNPAGSLCTQAIAPGLNKIGIMLPCSPLLLQLAAQFGKPLVATSANISGSPILYRDGEALEHLSGIADYILTYERDIVTPQDDSVLQFTASGQRIVLRRSRGLAPNYFPNPFKTAGETVLAMGGDLKSAFALLTGDRLYVSQYLGNQQQLESQENYTTTLHHMLQLLNTTPQHILADRHPGYFVAREGEALAAAPAVFLTPVQHHEAHFAAVLAENNLLQCPEPVLGMIWDGTGYGNDEQAWGGETFLFDNGAINRVASIDYFPQLLGDKMSREPRLSALSLLSCFPGSQHLAETRFTDREWKYYRQLLKQPHYLFTSSIGRLLDGIASLLGICQYNTYEGEAAMRMEALAALWPGNACAYYDIPLHAGRLEWQRLVAGVLKDLQQGIPAGAIAWKVFYSLAHAIVHLADYFSVNRIAFSGGVFQNALLTDMVIALLSGKKQLYFHRQLSPNDECIGFGQLAWYQLYRDGILAKERAGRPQNNYSVTS